MSTTFKICILVIVAVLAIIGAQFIQTSRVFAFACTSTASTKGHTEWIFGFQTNQWAKQSPLEKYLAQNNIAIHHNYVSFGGTGRNIFQGTLLHGHGRPGPIMQLLGHDDILNDFVSTKSHDDIMELYLTLQRNDKAEVRDAVDKIWQMYWEPEDK